MLTGLTAILLTAVAVTALSASLLLTIFAEERGVTRRLRELDDYESTQAAEVEPLLRSFADRVIRPLGRSAARIARAIGLRDLRSRLAERLVHAGHPAGLDADGVLALKILGGFSAGAAALALMLLGGSTFGRSTLAGLIVGGLAFFIPDLWLRGRAEARKLQIRRALPDMLDMLTISVEAGLGFDGAVAKLVSNSTGPLAEEFTRMLQEVQAGIPRQKALRNLAQRTGVGEVATFVMSIVQADVFGISVSKVLRTQANEMRVKRRQYAEEVAQKAPVKIVFPLVLCILPATLIVILGPAIVSIGRAFGLIN